MAGIESMPAVARVAHEPGPTPVPRPVPHAAPGRTAPRRPDACLHLIGGDGTPCGIGDFARLLAETMRADEPGRHALLRLAPERPSLAQAWGALDGAGAVVANFPVVAWKRALVAPLALFALARLRGRGRVVILHEWAGMHPLRRLVLRPVVALADTLFLVSPQVQEELAADPLVGGAARRAALMPVPPNVERPGTTADSGLRRRLAEARAEGRLVLGHFGSIYPGKQPEAVLAVAARLKALGARPLLVFVGAFIRASDGIEAVFHRRVAELGLSEDVVVSGYVADEAEMFGLFETIDAFAYVLPEGLTARRASVLACLQAGRPVVASAPARAHEFDHHPRYRALIESGALTLVPREAGPEAYAAAVLAVRERPTRVPDLDRRAWFRDAAACLRTRLP